MTFFLRKEYSFWLIVLAHLVMVFLRAESLGDAGHHMVRDKGYVYVPLSLPVLSYKALSVESGRFYPHGFI
jgi:hypothetical protein